MSLVIHENKKPLHAWQVTVTYEGGLYDTLVIETTPNHFEALCDDMHGHGDSITSAIENLFSDDD